MHGGFGVNLIGVGEIRVNGAVALKEWNAVV
jgi:hypothetical protein